MRLPITKRNFTGFISLFLFFFLFLSYDSRGQNVIIIVIDGARYTETCGAGNLYMPYLWKDLRHHGTLWTNFWNDSLTLTEPAHTVISTGKWQNIDNKGISRSSVPTIFEYFRKAYGGPITTTSIIVGKPKLEILAYSMHPDYGIGYKSFVAIEKGDLSVSTKLKKNLVQNHPRLTLVNFPGTDGAGHSGNWLQYVSAIHTVDSLIYDIWQAVQTDSFYRNNTTLIITNDHGRHDKYHGGFKNHGDSCEGCRHIMLFAIGRGFPANTTISKRHNQCDIAPTVGELLSFPTPYSTGTSLLRDIDVDAR